MTNVQLLQEKGIDLRKHFSGNIKTVCPQCNPTRKNKKDLCLSVDIDNGVWNCHHCSWKGRAFEKKSKEYKKPVPRLEKISKKTIEYFEEHRKISNNTLLRLQVTEAKEWMPQTETEVTCICFNYYRGNDLVNIKFRGPKKSFKLAKDAELIFYNLNAIATEEECVIVEGEIDCLSLHESGVYNVVSVPNGASKGSQKLEYLDNCWELFKDKKKIILMVDADEAGYALREELARRLGKEICWKVTMPEGCKDANEILIKYGKEQVLKTVTEATQWPIEGVFTMEDMIDDVLNAYDNGYPTGHKINVKDFDEICSFMPGELTTVTGVPGCFTKNQLVHTSLGVKKISEIKKGDIVLSYNHNRKINEHKKVLKTFKHSTHTDKLYRIKMKDGTVIEVTENHRFFTGTRYLQIKEILISLNNDTMEKNT